MDTLSHSSSKLIFLVLIHFCENLRQKHDDLITVSFFHSPFPISYFLFMRHQTKNECGISSPQRLKPQWKLLTISFFLEVCSQNIHVSLDIFFQLFFSPFLSTLWGCFGFSSWRSCKRKHSVSIWGSIMSVCQACWIASPTAVEG